jgi:hypothetical protein
MRNLLNKLQTAHPELSFRPGPAFYWSPETGEIFYRESADDDKARWALLHEVSHALLGHKNYHTDLELLQLEVAAWAHAERLAGEYDLRIDADHIQDCLDTYRDWLHGRSVCPTCTTRSLQQSDHKHYRCHNCHTSWRVSASRFCRPYRAVRGVAQHATVFAAEL